MDTRTTSADTCDNAKYTGGYNTTERQALTKLQISSLFKTKAFTMHSHVELTPFTSPEKDGKTVINYL